MSKLTKRIADAAKPDAHRDVFLWDSEVRGPGLRVKPNGRRSFFIQYCNRNGRSTFPHAQDRSAQPPLLLVDACGSENVE